MRQFFVGLSTLLLSSAAIAAPPASVDLLDELTADLEPAAASVAPPVEAAPIGPVRARTAPATQPVAAPTVAPSVAEAKPAGTPLASATKAEQTTLREATKQDSGSSSGSTAWALVGLALLLLGAVAVYLKKRAAAHAPWSVAANIETLSTTRIFGKHMVGLVRIGNRVLVLGYSDKGLTLLTELDETEVPSRNRATVPPVIQQTNVEVGAGSFLEKVARMRDTWGGEAPGADPFQEALAKDAPVDELVRMDERAAIRERLEALRRNSIAVA